jgi:hypothetical protein
MNPAYKNLHSATTGLNVMERGKGIIERKETEKLGRSVLWGRRDASGPISLTFSKRVFQLG